MLITALTVAGMTMMAYAPMVATGGRADNTGRAPLRAATLGPPVPRVQGIQGVPAEHLCPKTGLIKSWKAASIQDTDELRQAVENGFLDGFTVKDVKSQHTRYNRFTNKCLGDKISNLRRTHRDNIERRQQMDDSNGGGQGLQAQNNFNGAHNGTGAARMPNPRQAETDDEGDFDDDYVDGDDDYTETMSRLSVQDDEFSFASHAQHSRATTSGGNSVAFARGGASVASRGSAISRPAGILRKGSTTRRKATPSSGSNTGYTTTNKGIAVLGGCLGQYTVNRWLDGVPQKRYTVHCRLISGSDIPVTTSFRVCTDQHAILLAVPVSDHQLDAMMASRYLFQRVKDHMPYIDTTEKFEEYIKTHPAFIAKQKTIKRMMDGTPVNPMESMMTDLRILIDPKVKISHDVVTKEEDPICYGFEFIRDIINNECHVYIELKEVKKDGFGSPEPVGNGRARVPNLRTNDVYINPRARDQDHISGRGMGNIPEEVSIETGSCAGFSFDGASTVRTARSTQGGGSTRGGASRGTVRDMDLESRSSGSRFNEYLEEVEDELLGEIIARPSDDASLSISSEYTGASKMKSPKKKSKAIVKRKTDATMPTKKKGATLKPPPRAMVPFASSAFASGASVSGRSRAATVGGGRPKRKNAGRAASRFDDESTAGGGNSL